MSELGDKERRFVEDQRRIESAAKPIRDLVSDDFKAGVEMAKIFCDVERKDALLAEAAEVLRAFPYGLVVTNTVGAQWWLECAKPLLDKLEG